MRFSSQFLKITQPRYLLHPSVQTWRSYVGKNFSRQHLQTTLWSTRRRNLFLRWRSQRTGRNPLRLQASGNLVVDVEKTGKAYPIGISLTSKKQKSNQGGVNFAVISRNALKMSLCLFRSSLESEVASEVREIVLDPYLNRTGDIWHVQIDDLEELECLYYGWKADGLHGWEGGSRFHSDTVLLDPFAQLVMPVKLPGHSEPCFLGSLTQITSPTFDWEGVCCPRHGYEDLTICELDVASLGQDLEFFVQKLADAGINGMVLKRILLSGKGQGPHNQAPLSFFAPDLSALGSSNALEASHRLKTIIKELHKHSIEALMEVQYCFTGETDTVLSLKGLDVSLYFRGKGILNCGHPIVHELILTSLRFWKQEYKIDGFIFVNSETMTQDRDGVIQDAPSLPEAIATDPILRYCKLVAISGNDELIPRQGERGFPHWGVWTEYNNRFQFDFWDFMVMNVPKKLSNIATRVTGSPDLFASCWDGKFPGNLAVGRRPGFGFNSPVGFSKLLLKALDEERAPVGMSLKPKKAQTYNMPLACAILVATSFSQGVPVFPEDCTDPRIFLPFIQKLITFRRKYADLIQPPSFEAIRDFTWHGVLAGLFPIFHLSKKTVFVGDQPDWDGIMDSSFIGYSCKREDGSGLYVAFNSGDVELLVQTPELAAGFTWKCIAYTAIPDEEDGILLSSCSMFTMDPRTAVLLEAVKTTNQT